MNPFILVGWSFALGFGWLWWRAYKTGVVDSHGGKFNRLDNPFNYWFAMVFFGIAIVAIPVLSTVLALGIAS